MTYLLSGPLMTTPERRQALVERMAKDLVDNNAFLDARDSFRVLCGFGYCVLDSALLVQDAMTAAFQIIVAREMSES